MKSLVLIPSNMEYQLFQDCIDDRWRNNQQLSVDVCGVGLVAAAVGSTLLLNRLQPDQVFLLGIAGLLNAMPSTVSDQSALSISDAVKATSVVQHGIGVGEAGRYQSSESMGFLSFNSDIHLQTPDKITLQGSSINATKSTADRAGQFLSVTSASSCPEEANQRCIVYPDALIEDMETYSVALACHASGVPLVAIRGISNVAGDRDFRNWNSKAAMLAASEILLDHLS